MMIRIFFFLSVSFLLTGHTSFGQGGWYSGPPALETYVREAVAANLGLKQEQLEVEKAVQSLRQAKALFYPQLTFAPTYSVAFGGRRLTFPVGDMLNPAYAALNELTGTNQFPTNIPNINELLAPHNFHDTKVSFQYAVYNPEIRYNHLIRNSLLSAEEAKVRVMASELRYSVKEAYYQYLQALRVKDIYTASQATLLELVRLNRKLVENNVLTKDAVLSAEYEMSVTDQQLVEADKNLKVAKAYFNFLLNRDMEGDIVADTLQDNAFPVFPERPGLQELISSSLSGRQELDQLEHSIIASRHAEKLQQKAAVMPSVFLGGNAGFQGFGYHFANQGYMIAQVGLQWDLFKGYERKAQISQAHIQTEILKTKQTEVERQIELEVTRAYHTLKAAFEGLKVTEAGVRKATAYHSLMASRYRNHHVLLIEYFKARTDLETARIRQVLAQYEFLTQLAHLERVSGV